jgi:hypothetical protein
LCPAHNAQKSPMSIYSLYRCGWVQRGPEKRGVGERIQWNKPIYVPAAPVDYRPLDGKLGWKTRVSDPTTRWTIGTFTK